MKLRVLFGVVATSLVTLCCYKEPLNVEAEYIPVVTDVSSFSADFTFSTDIKIEEQVVEFTSLDKNMYTTALVNLRVSASTNSDVLKKVQVGSKVYVSGYETVDWYKVEYNGVVGYISSEYLADSSPLKRVSSTAYYNPSNNKTADCSSTVANFTLAGKKEWLGKGCYIYNCNSDGSVGGCRGYYEFHDTGWGIDGDILRGETVDIFMQTESECVTYGRQDIYILFTN